MKFSVGPDSLYVLELECKVLIWWTLKILLSFKRKKKNRGTPRVVYDLRERKRLKSFSFPLKQTITKGQKSLLVFVICALLSVRMFRVDNSERIVEIGSNLLSLVSLRGIFKTTSSQHLFSPFSVENLLNQLIKRKIRETQIESLSLSYSSNNDYHQENQKQILVRREDRKESVYTASNSRNCL